MDHHERREYARKWREEKKKDPEWVARERVRQRKVKQDQRADPVSGAKLREDERRRHRDRCERDSKYRDRKRDQSWEKYHRDKDRIPDFNRQRTLKHRCKKYGITLERFYQMVENQAGLCRICYCPEVREFPGTGVVALSIDHCHKTGKVRGLLCDACNIGIGRFDDRIELLERAIEYLKGHSVYPTHHGG